MCPNAHRLCAQACYAVNSRKKKLARAEDWAKGINVAVGQVTKRSINLNLVLAYADMFKGFLRRQGTIRRVSEFLGKYFGCS